MTYDPNLPPSSRERLREREAAASTYGSSTTWLIGLVVLAIIVVGAFLVWPDRAANVAGGGPDTTGTTATRPAPTAPAPASPPPSDAAPSNAAPSNAAPATPR
ncbi:MAG: hypothetical protein ACK4MV_16055 [Beijerinckiaceae bacterium]